MINKELLARVADYLFWHPFLRTSRGWNDCGGNGTFSKEETKALDILAYAMDKGSKPYILLTRDSLLVPFQAYFNGGLTTAGLTVRKVERAY